MEEAQIQRPRDSIHDGNNNKLNGVGTVLDYHLKNIIISIEI